MKTQQRGLKRKKRKGTYLGRNNWRHTQGKGSKRAFATPRRCRSLVCRAVSGPSPSSPLPACFLDEPRACFTLYRAWGYWQMPLLVPALAAVSRCPHRCHAAWEQRHSSTDAWCVDKGWSSSTSSGERLDQHSPTVKLNSQLPWMPSQRGLFPYHSPHEHSFPPCVSNHGSSGLGIQACFLFGTLSG